MDKNEAKLFEQITKMKMLTSQILNEHNLNEIDWEDKFGDVTKQCINPEWFKNYLNHMIDNYKKPSGERESMITPDKPYIHNKALPVLESGEIDINEFIKKITQIPNQILSINTKMEHTEDDDYEAVNLGIPALKGLVFDLEHEKFYFITTCPGATKECIDYCYARNGRYIAMPNIFVKQTRILNLLLNDPKTFENLLRAEVERAVVESNSRGKTLNIRWNDAGDFFGKTYLNIAVDISNYLKEKNYSFVSTAYTKTGKVINIANNDIVITFSGDAAKKQRNAITVPNYKKQETVPKSLFDDLFQKEKGRYVKDSKGSEIYKDEDGAETLKWRIADYYNINKNRILTYDELKSTPTGEPLQYYLMVKPHGEGDLGAIRRDVETSFLMYH